MPHATDSDVTAPVHFIKWLPLFKHEKPFNIFINLPKNAEDTRTNNLEFDVIDTTFHNIRGQESDFSLDDHGFQFIKYTHDFEDFENRNAVETVYLPQVEQMVRENIPDAEEIALFEWRVSLPQNTIFFANLCSSEITHLWTRASLEILKTPQTGYVHPRTHISVCRTAFRAVQTLMLGSDHGLKPILNRVRATFPDDHERLLKKRVRVVK